MSSTDRVHVSEGREGLPKISISHPSGSRCEVYLHGAHVTSWVDSSGQERLFLSRASRFEPGIAIRGGIPICLPAFADTMPGIPKHGFARNLPWSLVSSGVGPDGDTHVTLELIDSESSRAVWPFWFRARLRVSLSESLTLHLRMENRDRRPFAFTGALHTYLRVPSILSTQVQGLQGGNYRDTALGGVHAVQAEDVLCFERETNRIYFSPGGDLSVRHSAGQVRIERSGFDDVVIWNPWLDNASALPDMIGSEYGQMLCVEPAVVGHPISLGPGEWWEGSQRLHV